MSTSDVAGALEFGKRDLNNTATTASVTYFQMNINDDQQISKFLQTKDQTEFIRIWNRNINYWRNQRDGWSRNTYARVTNIVYDSDPKAASLNMFIRNRGKRLTNRFCHIDVRIWNCLLCIAGTMAHEPVHIHLKQQFQIISFKMVAWRALAM